MAKDKKGSKASATAPLKPEHTKMPLETVKAGRVTKPSEQATATAKEIAKKASKKVQKPVEPESSDDDSDATSASSESSDEEVETKTAPKTNGKVNGHAAKASDSESSEGSDIDSEGSSDGSDSDEDEAPKVNGKVAGASDSADDSDDDSDESSEGSGSDSEGNVAAKSGAKKTVDSDASDADSSDASSSGSEEDSDDEEEDEEEKPVAKDAGKKRKAEEAIEQTPKKTKATVDGELKDATPNLFVGNLSWNVDEEWLYREFESFGDLKNVRIITDRDSGRSKGYGYVEFNTAEKAAEALEAMTGANIDGRDIRVDFSVPRQNRTDGQTPQQRSFDRAQKYGDTPREASATLFVGNISFNADESMVTELFEEYGTIKAVRLPTDRETGQPKGFGYVEYYTVDEAKAAYEALQGGDLSGRPMRLDYSTPRNNDSPASGGKWSRGGGGDRGGFRGDRGGRGGRGGFNDRGRGGRGGGRGGARPSTTNRGGFGDFSGKKISF